MVIDNRKIDIETIENAVKECFETFSAPGSVLLTDTEKVIEYAIKETFTPGFDYINKDRHNYLTVKEIIKILRNSAGGLSADITEIRIRRALNSIIKQRGYNIKEKIYHRGKKFFMGYGLNTKQE